MVIYQIGICSEVTDMKGLFKKVRINFNENIGSWDVVMLQIWKKCFMVHTHSIMMEALI